MTHDEVRETLKGLYAQLAPGLAKAVLDRDYAGADALAIRVDSLTTLLAGFEEESKKSPGIDGILLLNRLMTSLPQERERSSGPKGPSIWELIQRPAV